MAQPPEDGRIPLFVERQTYRRRRLMDAVRALPVLGAVLWLVPLLWSLPENEISTADALIYLFSVWIGLIVVTAGLKQALLLWERRAVKNEEHAP